MIRFLLISLMASILMAAKAERIYRLQGSVHSFTEKKVVLINRGIKFEVPRNFVGIKKLKLGEPVEVAFNKKEERKIKRLKAK